MITNPDFLCNSIGMYCESKASAIFSQDHKRHSFMLREPRVFLFSIGTKKSARIKKSNLTPWDDHVKMKHQLDIVVPVIINDSKRFLDDHCQFALLNMSKIHKIHVALLNRESVKIRSLWSMKTWHMRGPVGFGYAIELNWCTKELQGVWRLET